MFHLSVVEDRRRENCGTRIATRAGRSNSARPNRTRMVKCRQSIWQSRYLAIRTMSRSIAVLASSADGRPQMRLPMRAVACAKACSTRAIRRAGCGPIGGQRDVPDYEWLRQPHPSQEAERPRYARDDAAGQQCEIENPSAYRARVCRAKASNGVIRQNYRHRPSKDQDRNGQSRLQHQAPYPSRR
jgi:hypothetical protein